MIEALDIFVTGVVQGVGFRPFVYRLAKRNLVNGWVLNATDGVHIHAEAETKLLDEFVIGLSEEAPAAAQVKEIELKEVVLQGCTTFEIRESQDAEDAETTLVSPDLAMCDDCLAEMLDPGNRRYRYPFTNCTNCGPRFTIIDKLPYDRPQTSMRSFAMCDACEGEYTDPANRRYHAQPNACFDCGPALLLCDLAAGGRSFARAGSRAESDAFLAATVDAVAHGGIAAVKGLGGFHLVCDAFDAQAIAALRARKHRPGKPFAVMVANLEAARRLCNVSADEERVLTSAARPIVLMRKNPACAFAAGLADKLPELGVMLPATPVQHLLIRDFATRTGRALEEAVLVMTSGNLHDEPIITDDAAALSAFSGVADIVLGNDRPVKSRYDDSVVRVVSVAEGETAVQMVRRARGFAPAPLAIDAQNMRLLACGPEQKNTFALAAGDRAFVSQHIGDCEQAPVFDAYLDTMNIYERLFDVKPAALACDAHPEYLSSKWAREQGLPIEEVQHHHAHIASVIGEHNIEGAVCGFAFDGTGYGADGCIWGGEVLLVNRRDYERFAQFGYIPMPGGAAAVRDSDRMAYGALWAFDLLEHSAARPLLDRLGEGLPILERMVEQGINTPMTSSLGRLFDAAAAVLGVCSRAAYEGEPAILLEAAMGPVCAADAEFAFDERYAPAVVKNTATEESTAQDTAVLLIDAAPTFEALLDDLELGVDTALIAQRFHEAIAHAVLEQARLVNAVYGITTVALSGGVWMNRYLLERSCRLLGDAGFTVALNSDLPPNDGCVSYGQAVVACARKKASD